MVYIVFQHKISTVFRAMVNKLWLVLSKSFNVTCKLKLPIPDLEQMYWHVYA